MEQVIGTLILVIPTLFAGWYLWTLFVPRETPEPTTQDIIDTVKKLNDALIVNSAMLAERVDHVDDVRDYARKIAAILEQRC